MLARVLAITLLIGVSNEAPASGNSSDWQLRDARTFDLGLDADVFRGRLAKYPDLARCHTQGLAVAGDRLVVSCTMFKSRRDRASAARGLLLSAPLSDIEAGSTHVDWRVADITEPASKASEVLGHPSGLSFDGVGVWCANAVYAPNSESVMARYDPRSLSRLPDPHPIRIADHIGTVVKQPGSDTVFAFNWDSEDVYRIGLGDGSVARMPNERGIAYQDCDATAERVFCGGTDIFDSVLDVLAPSLEVQGHATWKRLPGRGIGHSLAKEGFALSPDRRYAYFLPDDLPRGKLIRMRVDDGHRDSRVASAAMHHAPRP